MSTCATCKTASDENPCRECVDLWAEHVKHRNDEWWDGVEE